MLEEISDVITVNPNKKLAIRIMFFAFLRLPILSWKNNAAGITTAEMCISAGNKKYILFVFFDMR